MTAVVLPEAFARLPKSKEHVLDAAALVLRRCGYDGTAMRAIAAEAGIQAASLYSHFASKDQLVQIVLDRGILLVHRAVSEAMGARAGRPPLERLEAAVGAHLESLFDNRDYTFASIKTYAGAPAAIRRSNARLRRAYEDLWIGLLAEVLGEAASRPSPYARTMRLMLLGGMNAVIDWHQPDGELSLAELARNLTLMVGRAARGREREPGEGAVA